jgi:orotidine-5'-phosphate decarboxylase
LSYRLRMEESEKQKNSKIILALDQVPNGSILKVLSHRLSPHLALDKVPSRSDRLLKRSLIVLEEVSPYLCAVKLNRHLVLPLGLHNGVKKIVDKAHSFGLLAIMDCKINDIGYTNRVIAENYFKAGFDAVTANPFVGWEDGLQPVFEVARASDRGVILLVYMSHKAAWEGYGQQVVEPKTRKPSPQYVVFAEKALSWKADGAVVGATYPEKVKEIHAILGDKIPIYSPGVGAQGGDIKAAVEAGSHYLIVGRSITLADEPGEATKKFRDSVESPT